MRGRGTDHNPPNRFDRTELVPDSDQPPWEPNTETSVDATRSIVSFNDSPDVGFDASVNPYRGCEHGCSYCYARPMHEYLGLSAGLDFETRILVKANAPELLRQTISRETWKPQPLALSGATDPYQPLERKLGLTRRCLEVLAEFRHPVIVITKNQLVTRDIDLLSQLAAFQAARVYLSINSLDTELSRKLEPRTSTPEGRLKALGELSRAGVPCGVLVAPVVPGLTDHEIPRVLEAAAGAGATFAGYIMLRLPHGVEKLFKNWLEKQVPNQARKVLFRIESVRDGRLNDASYGSRMRGSGPFAVQVEHLFRLWSDRSGLSRNGPALSGHHFRRVSDAQADLFTAE